MKKEISPKGVGIEDEVLSNDFYEIMENNNNVSPFVTLFWDEQKNWLMVTQMLSNIIQ